MASKALFGVSQSSLLLQQPKLGLSQGRTTVCLISVRSPTIASFSSGLRASNRTDLRAAIISDAKSSDSFTVDSATKKSDVELDSGGGSGGGFSGNEGGGDGGGGDDNNRGDGDGESHEEGGEPKKMAMSMSQKLTLGYAALVGVGGLMGYLKSGSQKSLLSGGLSAALLFFVFTQLPTKPVLASSLGLGISAVLLIVMGSRFKSSGKIFPAGVVSLISLVMTGGYFHGIQRGAH